MPENVGICLECGTPADEKKSAESNADTRAPRGRSKKLVIGCIAMIFLIVIAAVGILFAIGGIGNKGVAGRTETTESPVQAEAGQPTEKAAAKAEKKTDQVREAEDKAWEAYKAYKKVTRKREEDAEDAYYEAEDAEEEYDEYGGEDDDVNDLSFDIRRIYQYAFIYLDADDYPEMLEWDLGSTVANKFLYTYKKGEVMQLDFQGNDISYRERFGYIHDVYRHSEGFGVDNVAVLRGVQLKELFSKEYSYDERDAYTIQGIAEEINMPKLGEGEWIVPEYYETCSEAFVQLLKMNREKGRK